ncbi:rhamnogalacturonan acetylesterase [Pedobacter sp. P351]|uniref:rhamnogalacturonan acetylesterase n=1 Tax=Pedobacter superstes TaxID=3133441 RepID=UPI0030A7290F
MGKFYKSGLLVLAFFLSSFILLRPKEKPTLFLIGDSTVKNGTYGRGDGGLWGWGSFLHNFFDTTKIAVQNRALGGTSSRSFQTNGLWAKVLNDIKPGDFVLIQFGHNDNGSASIKGNGDETREVEDPKTKQKVIAHSYGWNLRKYISDTRAKGATPVVLSLVPRNIWTNGKINRATNDFSKWAREAAEQERAAFVDLNRLIADQYDKIGEGNVLGTYFTSKDHTHTIEAGAKMNAGCVVDGLKELKKNPLKKYLLKSSSH